MNYNKSNNMKEQIHEILINLNKGRITVDKAQEQLLGLFSKQKLVKCNNCGDNVEMISEGEFCPNCFC